jgi:hypothetical protein
MPEQPYLLLVVVVAVALIAVALIAWIIAAIVNRPKCPEHDLRRRALAIVAGFGATAITVAARLSAPVAIVLIVACALVVPAGLYLVLRSPPPPPSPQ